MHGLEDIYYAEKQILKALPKMIEKAADAALKQGLQSHLEETEGQVKRLEQVFESLDQSPKGTKCYGIEGLLREGDHVMGETEGEDLLNVAIISAAQAVEHYEMTRYGALIAWAKELGRTRVVPLLAANLAEEKAADAKLTVMAERRVNPKGHGEAGMKPARKSTARRAKAKSTGRSAAAPRRAAAGKKVAAKKAAPKRKGTGRRARGTYGSLSKRSRPAGASVLTW
jgi:ferritin-like metal-binding protein YciE